MKRVYILTAVIGCLTLSGCSLAPDYVRPESPVSARWPVVPVSAQESPVMAETPTALMPLNTAWKTFFSDPALQKLIACALDNNRDVRLAALAVERARAAFQVQKADQLPSVEGTGQGSNQGNPGTVTNNGERTVSRQYTASIGLSGFELDFFGRVRSLNAQALEQYLSTEEAFRAARVSLVAEVASAYLTLAADREALALSQETLTAQQAAYDLVKKRYTAGLASELAVWQAQTSVDTARVSIARYTEFVEQDMSVLRFLVGGELAAQDMPVTALRDLPPWQPLTAGLSSEILLQRPDVLQAEHLLKAANANIGAARANFFPRITLSTGLGTSSRELADLFTAGTAAWSFVPAVTLPIFDSGRNSATLRMSETDRDMAVARYEKAVQTAFKEVSNALVRRVTLDDQLKAQESLTHAASESYRLSRLRFDRGVDSYLPVLDSQRILFASQLSLVTTRVNREQNVIQLYKALGGGVK